MCNYKVMRILALALTLLSPLVFAQEKAKEIFGTSVTTTVSPWAQHSPGKDHELNLKGRLRVDGFVNLDSKGCLQVKARLTTGDKLNNEFFNTGIGTNDADLTLSLRQLYVSAACLKNLTVEAGAVPVRNFGSMGLSGNGYIDGVQVVIKDEENKREFILSAGQVDPVASLLKRSFNDLNHISAQVKQDLGDVDPFLSLCLYEDTMFSRAGVTWALTMYSKWLQEAGAEVMMSDSKLIGGYTHVKLNVKNFETRLVLSTINPDPKASDKLAFQMKQFYGYGKNALVEVSRNLPKDFTVNLRLRVGDAGPLAQVGLTKTLKLSKKRKPATSL